MRFLRCFSKNAGKQAQFLEMLYRVEVKEGDLIVIAAPDDRMDEAHEFALGLVRDHLQRCRLRAMICVVPVGVQLQAIPEEQMRRMGWMHVPRGGQERTEGDL